jgi:membrane protein
MEYIEKIERHPAVRPVIRQLNRIKIPGFRGASLYLVLRYYTIGLIEGFITSRAASISFSFFMAMFPFTIFLLTIIPYIPINGFQEELFLILSEVVPPTTWETIESTLDDIINIKRGGLLSFNFLLAVFFANNGVLAIVTAFNATFHDFEVRSLFSQYKISITLTFVLSLFVIIAVSSLIFTEGFLGILVERGLISIDDTRLIRLGQFVIFVALIFFTISMLFYYGPAKRKHYSFFSPGPILSTALTIISSFGFRYYVVNLAQYNKLYGSIGTLLVILLWIYINSIILLLGFELNASIANAQKELDARLDTNE